MLSKRLWLIDLDVYTDHAKEKCEDQLMVVVSNFA